ncbi:thioredoxin reductase [Virgisporangium aliadipatigenens]|uniref:Thioredoxin reductase n=1 Tax=Virgisporangium aliadipatigenens TaxID=741659 RepID=A0A8J3YVQ1_9ACTN|nr:thioredoxin-disulfide reductase [Virgisporangium aliadipatigenens]GIJ50675.1 thioredoxin reductase [Virgisporangium aliadipatigenens]
MNPDLLDSPVVVLGGGPAGYAAAIYLARAELRPIVVEGAQAGGALMTTTTVANYPGFADGILGPDLMEAMRLQAAGFGATFVDEDATAVDLTGPVKRVHTTDRALGSRAVILATGSRWRRLDVPGEEDFVGRGVGSCATCDGAFFRDQDVAVVGGGDSALEEATFLTRFARSVTLVHRRDTLRASRAMQKRAAADAKITVLWNHETVSVVGEDTVSALRVRHTVTHEERALPVTGVFVAIGHDPASDLFRDQVEVDRHGYVLTLGRSTRTNVPGVFAAGDLADPTYRQAITSAGTGAAAALDAEQWLAAAHPFDKET